MSTNNTAINPIIVIANNANMAPNRRFMESPFDRGILLRRTHTLIEFLAFLKLSTTITTILNFTAIELDDVSPRTTRNAPS